MDFSQIPPSAVSLLDYERLSTAKLSESSSAYLNGGAADKITMQRNRDAWQKKPIIPRVLTEQSKSEYVYPLLGHQLTSPILIAPTAYHNLFHADGEIGTALAAKALGVPYVVSTQASTPIEEIARIAEDSPLWFQLYMQRDREFTKQLVRKAELFGYEAIVLTVDAPVNGIRNDEQRAQFALPQGICAVNLQGMKADQVISSPLDTDFRCALPTWSDIEWLKSVTSLPILIKGILHPEDAHIAIEHGANGIIVSNHGGRVLDQVIATREALSGIIEIVANKVPVLVDGGIRRGTDVLQALELGAAAVLLGRPILHGLSVAGAAGVAHVLKLIQHEFETAVLLSGYKPSHTLFSANKH